MPSAAFSSIHDTTAPRPSPPAAQAIARAKKAREDRKNAAPTQVDGMQLDPQAAELNAAGGLKSKVLSEDEIELTWETSDEHARPVQTVRVRIEVRVRDLRRARPPRANGWPYARPPSTAA